MKLAASLLRGIGAVTLAVFAYHAGAASDVVATARDLVSKKKWSEVVSTLEEYLRFQVSSPEIDDLMGQALLAQGRKDEAAHYFDRAASTSPADSKDVARIRKRLVEADPLATRRETLFKQIAQGLLQCAQQLEAGGHSERALEVLERIRPLASGSERDAIGALTAKIRSATEEVKLDQQGGPARPADGWPEIVLESEHYTLKVHLEREVAELLGRTMDEIFGFYVKIYFDGDAKHLDSRKPTIVVHESHEAMMKLWKDDSTPGGWWSPGEWVVHAYDTRTDTGSLDEMLNTLFHEASHHFMTMLEKGGNTPAWINEGTATFFEGCSAMADGRVLWPDAAKGRLQGLEMMLKGEGVPHERIPKLADVIGFDEGGSYPAEYYEFGWGLVYFCQQYEEPTTLEYVYRPYYQRYRDEIIQKGSEPRALFERVFLGPNTPRKHTTFADFERDWRDWIVNQVYPLHFGVNARALRLAKVDQYLAAAKTAAGDKKAKVSEQELLLRALGHLEFVRTKIDRADQPDAKVLLAQAQVLEHVGRASSAAPILEQLLEMASEGTWEASEEELDSLSKRLTKMDQKNAPLRMAQARANGFGRRAEKLLADYQTAKSPLVLRSYTFAKLASAATEDATLAARADELRTRARETGLLHGAAYHLEGEGSAWVTIFNNRETAFEHDASHVTIQGDAPVGRLSTAIPVTGEYEIRARLTRSGDNKITQQHGLVVSGTASGDWMVVSVDFNGKLTLRRMNLGGGGVSDVVVSFVKLKAPPPIGEPFAMVVHVDPKGSIEVTVGDDGPYPFQLPLALPAVGHVGVFVKYGTLRVEDAVIELYP